MNAFLQRGENAIFLIKHNTDYVHNLKNLLILPPLRFTWFESHMIILNIYYLKNVFL